MHSTGIVCAPYDCINTSGFILRMEYLEKYGIQLSVFMVMNSMKFRAVVWKSMDYREFSGDIFQYIFHAI